MSCNCLQSLLLIFFLKTPLTQHLEIDNQSLITYCLQKTSHCNKNVCAINLFGQLVGLPLLLVKNVLRLHGTTLALHLAY